MSKKELEEKIAEELNKINDIDYITMIYIMLYNKNNGCN